MESKAMAYEITRALRKFFDAPGEEQSGVMTKGEADDRALCIVRVGGEKSTMFDVYIWLTKYKPDDIDKRIKYGIVEITRRALDAPGWPPKAIKLAIDGMNGMTACVAG